MIVQGMMQHRHSPQSAHDVLTLPGFTIELAALSHGEGRLALIGGDI